MKVTPDSRHVVAYDVHGSIRVIDDAGAVEREVKASDLRGAVSSGAWAVAVSPDASRVALGTDQGTVAVINTATGVRTNIQSEGDSAPIVRWMGSAAKGLVLVVSKLRATESGAAATYSPDTGKLIARFPGDVSDALPLADDQHIVTSEKDGKLRVWDAQTGTKVAESPALSPTEKLRLTSSAESVANLSVVAMSGGPKPSIVVWDWHAGLDPVRYPVNGFNDVCPIVVNEPAKTVLVWQDKEVRTYSLIDGSLRASLPRQTGMVTDVVISPDGQWITTASADGRVLVWFPGHRQSPTAPTYALLAHRGEATRVSYLPDRKVVMSLGIDGTVQRWELPQVPRFEGHDDSVVHLDLSRDGQRLATASQDGQAFIIDPHDLSTSPVVATVPAGTPLQLVLFDPTEPHRILTLGKFGTVPTLWRWDGDGKPAERLLTYQIPPLPAFVVLVSLAISPDGQTVAGGDSNGAVHLWDAMTGALRTDHLQGTGQPADGVAFDPTGRLLAATESGGIRLWRLGTTEPPTELPHPHATTVAFDPSGQRLASTDGDGTVKIWTWDGKTWTRDGKPDRELVAYGHLSSGPSFSGDGRLLAMGTAGGLVEVWDVRSGVTVLLDRHHSAPVNSVIFLPRDGSRLISASDDTTVAQFSCPACTDPDRVIREAVERAEMNPETP
jgi:WD40 repeat protein